MGPYFDFDFDMIGGSVFAAFMAVYIIILLIASMFGIVSYVFRSLGVYTLAKRRGIENYGLAWVPVADSWIIGSLADDYEMRVNGKESRLRHWLLWLMIGGTVLIVIATVLIIVTSIAGATSYSGYHGAYVALMIISVFALVLASGALIAWNVFNYIALYKIYKSCLPDYSVMFTVLSVLFNVAVPFFLFGLRNKDEGLPEDEPDIEVEYVIYDIPQNEEKAEQETEAEQIIENKE